jgi:excinuclease ABC subunit C
VQVPRRGEKRGLVELATRNAVMAYQSRFTQGTTANYEALDTLRRALALPAVPRRIECFDVSTIQGAETVASLVVCEDGRMKRSAYRTFRVRRASDASVGPSRAQTRQRAFSTTSRPCARWCCGGTAGSPKVAASLPI